MVINQLLTIFVVYLHEKYIITYLLSQRNIILPRENLVNRTTYLQFELLLVFESDLEGEPNKI